MARNDGFALWWDGWSLALEASAVIGTRLAALATMDPARAAAEMQLMVSEKAEAAVAIQTKAMTGQLGATPAKQAKRIVAHYRKAVGKNRRRLARPKTR